MGVLSLLARARQAGLEVRARGDRLVVTGPKRCRDLAEALKAAKGDVLAELESEARLAAAIRSGASIYPEDFKLRTVEDLLAGWGLGDPPARCFSCAGSRWWRLAGPPSKVRPWVCGTCHPPAVPADQVEWAKGGAS